MILSHTFSPEDLAWVQNTLRTVVETAKDPCAPLIPGEHCQHCRASSACPARRNMTESMIAKAPQSPVAVVQGMSPEQRVRYWERLRIAAGWVGSAIESIEAAVIAGELDVPGLTVAPGRKSRVWVADSAAETMLKEALGDRAYKRELLSPKQAEDLIAGQLGKRAAAALLKDHIATKPGKPRVARDGTAGLVGEE